MMKAVYFLVFVVVASCLANDDYKNVTQLITEKVKHKFILFTL